MKFRARVVEGQVKIEAQDDVSLSGRSHSDGQARTDANAEAYAARIRKAMQGPSPSKLVH